MGKRFATPTAEFGTPQDVAMVAAMAHSLQKAMVWSVVSIYPSGPLFSALTYDEERYHQARAGDVADVVASKWTLSSHKRVLDTVIALPVLIASLPLAAVIAVAIRCSSRGPVLFRQERVGLNQVPFTIYKFRTMQEGSESKGLSVTRRGDLRVTRVGLVLRKFKLDEVPQLVNVVRGEMSLVGPRPKLPEHEQMYMLCRPGITGAATLVFAREEEMLTTLPENAVESYMVETLNPIKAKLDLEYAQTATLAADVRILLRTVLGLGRAKNNSILPEF